MCARDEASSSKLSIASFKTWRLFWQALRSATTSSNLTRRRIKLVSWSLLGILGLWLLFYETSWMRGSEQAPFYPRGPGEVAVLVRTYEAADRSMLRALLYSIQAQTYKNFRVWLLESDNLDGRVFADEVRQMHDDRFSSFTVARPVALDNSYGYSATEIGINHVMDGFRNWWGESSARAGDGYILITNGDNLYHHHFLSKLVAQFESEGHAEDQDVCLVSTDFVTRYHSRTNTGAYGPRNQVRKAMAAAHAAELGAVLVSARAVQRAFPDRVRFVKHSTQADFAYFNTVWQASGGACWKTFGEVLFVHQ